ncbi:DUF7933 domain-containing protein [Pseudothauera rhizosphaerae]|uniref:DUF11 domain-containing protein n=1 Tax=Pseudothauera rhizosphaerae TaxID=2565932 RepID=A0A4S4AM63_9RHOO|nr:SdrD B-like domain-containing protein [Pseudothauera rhizosphaerae]THF60669.1 DUF11 domain-containing protein [Pseudothauera rhizosphaerae]
MKEGTEGIGRRHAAGPVAGWLHGAIAAAALLGAAPVAHGALGASVTLQTGQPTQIHPGETTVLQITLSNNNTLAPVTAVAFSNALPGTLPNGLRIAGAATYTCHDPAAGSTTAGSGTLTAAPGTQAIALSGGVIPARHDGSSTDGTCTILIPVTAGTSSGSAAYYDYGIGSGAVTGNDGAAVANSGAVTQTVNVRALAQPTIQKSFGSSTVVLGGAASRLTITVGNSNPVALPGFQISDAFPALGGGGAIIEVADPPNLAASCTSGGAPVVTQGGTAGDTAVEAGGTVPANGQCTIAVDVVARHSNGAYTTGARTNRISATDDFDNELGIRAQADATAPITARSPLRVTKSVNAGALASGEAGYFTITLHNDSSNALPITSFTDSPIDSVSGGGYGLAVTGQSTNCGGSLAATAGDEGVQLTGGSIPANGSCWVRIDFTGTVQSPNTPREYTNALDAGDVLVGTPGVVSQGASASVTVYQNLDVLKSVSPAYAAPGNPVRYSVTARNWSAAPISDLVVTDALANGQTFLTGTIGANDYTPTLSGSGCSGLSVTGATGDGTPVFAIGTVPARASPNNPGSCTVSFWAMTAAGAADGSGYGNQLPAGAVCHSGGTVCNGGASNNATGAIDDEVLAIAKAFEVASRPEGQVTRMTLTLSNRSANPLTSLALSDTLPLSGSNQLQIATPANAATTCGAATITAVSGSTSLGVNGGSVPARAGGGTGAPGSCMVQVDVVGAAGVYDNTATATATETRADGTTHVVSATSNTARLTYTSSLSGSKSFLPAAVASGGRSTVRIRLDNSGDGVLTGVGITDPLPAGMTVADPPNAYTTCAGPAAVNAAAGASTVELSGAAIAGGGSCDLVFDVRASGSSNWVNTIPVGNIRADGGVINQIAVQGTLVHQAPTGLAVAKLTNPSTLTFPGQVSELTIELSNGSEALSGLALTDYFTVGGTAGGTPNGMVIAANPAATTTCPGGIVTAAPGAASVTVSGVALAADASCVVKVNVSSTSVGGVTNTIPAGAVATDQGTTNAGAANTSLTTQSNIGLTKQFTPKVVKPGERSRLRITFFNPTEQPVTSLGVIDELPAGVTVPSGASPSTTCTGATVSAPAADRVQVAGGSLGAAAGGVAASCHAEIDVLVAAQGSYVNTIPAGAITAVVGGVNATNSQPATDTLLAKSPLRVTKAFGGLTLDAGNPDGFTTGTLTRAPGAAAVLTVRLSNPNAAPLTGAGFVDALPEGVVVATPPNAGSTCAGATVSAVPAGTAVQLSGATIPAGGSCDLTVDVLSNLSGSHVNAIPAGAVVTTEGVGNEEATRAELVVSTPPTVAKQFEPAVIPPNGISTLTIHLGNDNAAALTPTSALTDNLPTAPGAVVVAAVPNVDKTCPGAVTAAPGATTVTYANGAAIPPGGCRISVDVTAAVPGQYTNTIPAGGLQTDFGNNPTPAHAGLEVSTLGYISGRVFRDNDVVPDGSFDPGVDAPIAGALIELRSGPDCAGALLGTAATDGLGNYLFSGLAAGTYSVCQPVQPAGTVNGTTTAGGIVAIGASGGTPGSASNPTAESSRVAGIVLGSDGGNVSGSTHNDFAEIVPSSISGTVFLDHNNNGAMNGTDAGIAGVELVLAGTDHSGASVTRSATTGPDGRYVFDGLLPGTYTVTQPAQPADTANGITTAGAVGNGGGSGTATPVTTLPSGIAGIVLPPNTVAANNDFAEIPHGGRIEGRVFLDYDDDGVLDAPPDHGIGGVVLELTGTDVNGNPVSRTATTAADGSYAFTGLPLGTYTVTQPAQPAGTSNGTTSAGSGGGTASNPTATSSRIAGIVLDAANPIAADNDFGERPDDAPDLTIAKTHSPASFAAGGSTGFYTLTVGNISPTSPTSGTITVADVLPAGIVPRAAFGSGWSCAVAGQSVTCATDAVVAGGASAPPITLQVDVDAGLAGQILINTATVSGGSEPPGFEGNNSAEDPTPVSAAATVSGHVWRDLDGDRIRNGEPGVPGWRVELLYGDTLVATAETDAAGAYSITGIAPGPGYRIRFVEPTTGQVFGSAVPNEQGIVPALGVRDDPAQPVSGNAGNPAGAVTGDGTLADLVFYAGDNIVEQSLPLDPAGVVYDAVTRQPVAGAVVTISGPAGFDPALHLVGGSASVTTGADGLYQFLLRPGAPSGTYGLEVTTYPAGYVPQPSTIIPACTGTLNVGAVPAPAAVQAGADAPGAGAALHDPAACPASSAALAPANQGSTQYYLALEITVGSSADVVNNHIPIDPILGGAIRITKTSPLVNVNKGGLVPYTITATNTLAAALTSIDVVDQLPPGFKYRSGSASVRHGGSTVFVAAEPAAAGRTLNWSGQNFAAGESKTWRLVLVVGAGVGEGEYTNLAWAMNALAGARVSNVGSAVVRVIPDPLFDCSEIIGKVFDDRNANGYQDPGEPGIPNVRVVTARGLLVTADAEGRFHVACADIPQMDRGSNFVMKLDERTLPSGYRVTTENPRDVRTTRGKMVKLNFGATVHKVFRIEVDARAFDGDRLAPAWEARLRELLPQLAERPAVARLAYRSAGKADDGEAARRLDALGRQLRDIYRNAGTEDAPPPGERPPLIVETEIIGVAAGAQGEQQ